MQREPGPPAPANGLALLAESGALITLAAVGILRYGHRVLVPGSVAGVCVLAVLGLCGIGQLDLVGTALLGWLIGVGAAIVIMIVRLIVMIVTDPMP